MDLAVYADAFEWVTPRTHSAIEPDARRGRDHSRPQPYGLGGATLTACRTTAKAAIIRSCEENGDKACPFRFVYSHFLDTASRPVLEHIHVWASVPHMGPWNGRRQTQDVLAKGCLLSPFWTRARWSSRRCCLRPRLVLSAGPCWYFSGSLGVVSGSHSLAGGLACFLCRPFPAMHRSPSWPVTSSPGL